MHARNVDKSLVGRRCAARTAVFITDEVPSASNLLDGMPSDVLPKYFLVSMGPLVPQTNQFLWKQVSRLFLGCGSASAK